MPQPIISLLKSVNAIYTDDHFVFTSGKHSDIYINKDALYPHPKETSQVGELFAQKVLDEQVDVDVVVAPALGGIILSQWTSFHLTEKLGREINGVYAEKDGQGGFVIKRGYDAFIKGKNCLVLEDLTTTGGSVKKVVDTVMDYGGIVTAVMVMVNRNPAEVNSAYMGVPFFALGEMVVDAWEEADLPAEIAARPINTQIGHGKAYLAKKGQA